MQFKLSGFFFLSEILRKKSFDYPLKKRRKKNILNKNVEIYGWFRKKKYFNCIRELFLSVKLIIDYFLMRKH